MDTRWLQLQRKACHRWVQRGSGSGYRDMVGPNTPYFGPQTVNSARVRTADPSLAIPMFHSQTRQCRINFRLQGRLASRRSPGLHARYANCGRGKHRRKGAEKPFVISLYARILEVIKIEAG